LVDGRHTDWVVVRNRMSPLESRNRKKVLRGLEEIAMRLDFRLVAGITERVVFRELFLRGLTAFDGLDAATLGVTPTMSHLAARREITQLIDSLNLPCAPDLRGVAKEVRSPQLAGGTPVGLPPQAVQVSARSAAIWRVSFGLG
jgi:chromosome partitioning protein